MKLKNSFYKGEDVVGIARKLLGKHLFVNLDGVVNGGYITETEAYAGAIDKASHAYQNKRTKRTEVMFAEGGRTYVYLCYGIHALLNVVTAGEGIPHAVLIRGIWPTHGVDHILKRLGKSKTTKNMFDGPGKLSRALGINTSHNNLDLRGNQIWIEDLGMKIQRKEILIGPRIGIDYAEEDALLPYRFQIRS